VKLLAVDSISQCYEFGRSERFEDE